MTRWWLGALVVGLTGCWTEVFLEADTDSSTGASEATQDASADEATDDGCDGDPGNLICDGECVDPGHDVLHCGDCDIECEAGEICDLGECVFGCECDPVYETCDGERCLCREGTERCGDSCVALRNDASHCGECENDCDDVCLDFSCAADCGELTDCGRDCTDTELDPFNCGECGHECESEEACVFGTCRSAELLPFDCDECPCDGYCEGLDEGMTCCESLLLEGPLCVDTPICGE